MHGTLILYASLLTVVLFLVMLSYKINIPYPILLVVAGLAVSFIPAVPDILINPEIIFVVFLPPLLYEASWNMSWKDLWKFRRVISSFAFLIVIITSCVVAVFSNWLISGFTMALGFLLGGIVSPPDAVSASTIMEHQQVPRSLINIIKGESLLNDASSLIVYRFAIIAVMSGKFLLGNAALSFVFVIIAGIATGLAIALIFYAIHRWLPTTAEIDILLTLITPYAMYITAESLHVSGVLAVVSGGLFLSEKSETMLNAKSRLQGGSVWATLTFAINGLVFMLIGLELPEVVKQLGDSGLHNAIKYGLLISLVLIVCRLLCTIGTYYFTAFIRKFVKTEANPPDLKMPIIFGWAGMRGVVSLAAALSIPEFITNTHTPFPQRNIILFISFVVILVTLVFQGLTLPFLIKMLKIENPFNDIPANEQEVIIRKKLSAAALNTLEKKYKDRIKENSFLGSLQMRFEADTQFSEGEAKANEIYDEYKSVSDELINEQRSLLHTLNGRQEFNEDIIRKHLQLLDMEEEKLRQHFSDKID